MMLGLLGRVLCAIGRLRAGEEGRDLFHVGEELIRLDRRPVHARTTSR
jgi:hypothetical protein